MSNIYQNFIETGLTPIIGGLGICGTQGTVWHVMPKAPTTMKRNQISPSDNNHGRSITQPFLTLSKALSSATAGRNDIVLLYGESNTAGSTTDYQSATLNWNKDMVHLVGVNAGQFISQRSRVAFLSTYNTASNLFTLSANGCLIQGIEFFEGVAGTNPTGCVSVTGQHNHFKGCTISGMGNAANDIANSYSLSIGSASVASDENFFEDCYIGLDTLSLGTNTSQISFNSGGRPARTLFRRCTVATYAKDTTHGYFLNIGSAGIDRWVSFEDCKFLNPIGAGAATLANAFVVNATAGGDVLLDVKCAVYGVTKMFAGATGKVYVQNALAAGTSGLYILGTDN